MHIHTRQDPQRVKFVAGSYWGNTLLAHLRFAFLGHFLLKSGVNADQKAERSAGSEAGAATGGAGSHTSAGAEDPQNVSHSESAGAGPLQARQTNIAWTVVGGEGDRDFGIPGCRAGTRRAALSLPDQPLGATATSPGESGPPGQAAVKARDSEGAPRRILTSTRSSGPGPGGLVTESGGGTPRGSARPGEGTGLGGGLPAGGGLGRSLGPEVLNLPAIIAAAAAAATATATQGYAAAASVA